MPRKIEEKEDGGAPNEEEFSRKDNEEAFNISEFVSFLQAYDLPARKSRTLRISCTYLLFFVKNCHNGS